jgi:serine/threonine protein kinase
MPESVREYDIIEGPYEGTYGSVCIGQHHTLPIKRAIKRLQPFVKEELIKQEALKQQKVRSPYVVQVYDLFEDPLAILMEYCPKGLDEFLLERFHSSNPIMSYEEARPILQNVLQGLNDAHKVDVIHGDLKPANIRFGIGNTETEIGDAKISDFGAAKSLREEEPLIRGSTNWMAPELILSKDASPAADYFSFGIIAYLILAGRHPYYADDPTCLSTERENILNPSYRPKPLRDCRQDIPKTIADLIMDLLSKDKQTRLIAEQALKVALSEPVTTEGLSDITAALVAADTQQSVFPSDKKTELEAGYQEAKGLFFVKFRPKDAITKLNQLLESIEWKRYERSNINRIADCWSLQAFINNSSGHFEEAIDAASNGLRVSPTHVDSLHARGYAYLQLGKNAEALDDLEHAIEQAISPSKRDQIRGLLSTVKDRPAFFELVSNGTPQRVQAAIKAGEDVNARGETGMTPLMYAAATNGFPEVITILIKAGADVNARNTDGSTPLMWAAQFNQNPEVIQMLVKQGADVNAQSQSGMTPLMLAAKNPNVITALLEAGAEVNAQDSGGVTPLIEAAKKSHNPEVIMALLEAGADPTAKDRHNKTAFEYAQKNASLRGTDAYRQLQEESQ